MVDSRLSIPDRGNLRNQIRKQRVSQAHPPPSSDEATLAPRRGPFTQTGGPGMQTSAPLYYFRKVAGGDNQSASPSQQMSEPSPSEPPAQDFALAASGLTTSLLLPPPHLLRRDVVRGACGCRSSGADALVRGQRAACGDGSCAMDLGLRPGWRATVV
jgi:hypothetical protein